MQFEIFFDLSGAGGEAKHVPNKHNPVEAGNLSAVVQKILDSKILDGGMVQICGLTVREVPCTEK